MGWIRSSSDFDPGMVLDTTAFQRGMDEAAAWVRKFKENKR